MKVIGSIVALIAVTVVIGLLSYGCIAEDRIAILPGVLPGACGFMFLPALIFFGIPAFIIVYVVWSLTQKKKSAA